MANRLNEHEHGPERERGLIVALFLFGGDLPIAIVPPAVAIIAASLALLVVYGAKVETVDQVLRDIDWKTLVFLASIFCLVQAIAKTGRLQAASLNLRQLLGTDLAVAAVKLIAGIGLLSSLVANIPVVAAMLVMVKGYLVTAEVVPEAAVSVQFQNWPAATLPAFVAMMLGATLSGNGTLIGASANVVAGHLRPRGKPITFAGWLRYGLPVTVCQLGVRTRPELAKEAMMTRWFAGAQAFSRRGSDIGRGPVPYPHDRSAHADRRSRPGGNARLSA